MDKFQLIGFIFLGIVFCLWLFRSKSVASQRLVDAEKKAHDTLHDAQNEADSIIRKAHREAQRIINDGRVSVEKEVKSRRQSITDIEKRVMSKESHMEERESKLESREDQIRKDEDRIKSIKKRQNALVEQLSQTLEKVAGFSKEDAKKILFENVERETRREAGQMIKDMQEQAKKIANRKAKEIVVDAIQRTAVDHVVDATTSTVELTDDEMKGRIIGREGRNIRAFESITGVDVIVDESPGTVVLSAFDPIRREIARIAMSKLIQDGRIHPSRIEEMVEKAKKELDSIIQERGEQAAEELGLSFHPEIIKLMGKLHYRTSYGQNILAHSLEAAHVAGVMATQLGVSVPLAKRGTMLHDIGKAMDFEVEGTHVEIGRDIALKYGESPEVVNCIMAHHEDEPPETIEAILVMVADAVSSVRPGARRESLEKYIKRLEKLETIAMSFDGVAQAYAIQAGREIRVIVRPDEVDDEGMRKIAQDMAKQIESEVDYPGEVKVSLVRETRFSSTAH